MNNKKLLKEVTGVPRAIGPWIEVFSNIILEIVEESIVEDDFNEKEFDYVIDNQEIKGLHQQTGFDISREYCLKKTIDILGVGNLENLFNDSRFLSFPIYEPMIELDINVIPEDLFNYEFENNVYDSIIGAHSVKASEKMIGKKRGCPSCKANIVFINQTFKFRVFIPESQKENFNKQSLKRILAPTINHELVHAYETYQKILRNKNPFYGQEGFLNMLSSTLPDDIQLIAKDFMTLVYLHLYFEINARVSQLYQELIEKNVSTKDEFIEGVKNSSVWKELKSLQDFNAENYLEKIKSEFGVEGVKLFIENWDLFLQMLNKIVEAQGVYKGKFMSVVPQNVKENPVLFFKFFEKRFHEKAENFKNKLFKLYDVVINRTLVSENSEKITCPSCGHEWGKEINDPNPYLCHMCAYDSKNKKYEPKEVNKFWKQELQEKWSKKYKKSINCSNPKGFSQKAHCAGRRKRKSGQKTKSKSPFN